MKKLFSLISLVLTSLSMYAVGMQTPEQVALWRDSLELVYRQDASLIDIPALEIDIQEAESPVVRSVLHYLTAQCCETLAKSYSSSYRYEDFQRMYDRRTEHYRAVWEEMDALAQEPADTWMALMEDSIYGSDMPLLELLLPRIKRAMYLSGDAPIDQETLYYRVLQAYRQYGYTDAALRAEADYIQKKYYSEDLAYHLDSLLQVSLDTRAAGYILLRRLRYVDATKKQRLDMAEHYLPYIKDESDRAEIQHLINNYTEPYISTFYRHDTCFYIMCHYRNATLSLAPLTLKDENGDMQNLKNWIVGETIARQELCPTYEDRDWRCQPDTIPVTLDVAPGLYMALLRSDTAAVMEAMRVSSVAVLWRIDEFDRWRPEVVSVKDGSKVKGSRLQRRYNRKYKCYEVRAYLSDNDHSDWEEDYGRELLLSERLAAAWEIREIKREYRQGDVQTSIITDRAIYRPGQTVQIAAILAKFDSQGSSKAKLRAGKTVTLAVSCKQEIVFQKKFKTDPLGRIQTSFTIPEDAVPGSSYMIAILDGDSHINGYRMVTVDDYRRPTAKLSFTHNVLEDSCFFFAQVTMANGEPCRDFDALCVINQDTIPCQQMGNGMIRIYAGQRQESTDEVFSAQLKVTLPNGETLVDTEWLYPNHWPYRLYPAYSDRSLQDRDTITIVARDGRAELVDSVPLTISVEGYDTVVTFSAMTGQPIGLPTCLNGECTLKACAASDTLFESLYLFSPAKPVLPSKSMRIITSTMKITTDGIDVYIILPYQASSVKLQIVGGTYHRLVTIPCSGYMATYHLSYDPKMEQYIRLNAIAVHNGEVFEESCYLTNQSTPDDLQVDLEHFHDKTSPGADESWTLHVTDRSGKNVSGAAVVASMYDASLDQLAYMPDWTIDNEDQWPWYATDLYSYEWDMDACLPSWPSLRTKPLPFVNPLRLTFSGFNPLTTTQLRYDSKDGQMMGQPGSNSTVAVRGYGSVQGLHIQHIESEAGGLYGSRGTFSGSPAVLNEVVKTGMAYKVASDEQTEKSDPLSSTNYLRRDFRELALWTGTATTNMQGQTDMQVHLPDQLSTWHLRLLTYDKQLRQAQHDAYMQVEQRLTLQPLWPRFARVGDDLVIMAEARNRYDEDLKLTATFTVFHATPDSTHEYQLTTRESAVYLPAGQSLQLSEAIHIPAEWGDSILLKWTISNVRASDGEQVWLHILDRSPIEQHVETMRSNVQDVLRQQLESIRLEDAHDALRLALALYVSAREGKHNHVAEFRLRKLINSDKGIAWCPGMSSSAWVTMQVIDILLREGRHEDLVREAMGYVDACQLKESHRTLVSNTDLQYLHLSSLVERNRSAQTDSLLSALTTVVNRHARQLPNTRQAAHTPLTIYGVSLLGTSLWQELSDLRAIAANHVLRLSRYQEGWGRYFVAEAYNSRLSTQLAAIRLMDAEGQTQSAAEMRQWLASQVWSRAWQSPVLIGEGLDIFANMTDTVQSLIDQFDSNHLVDMQLVWKGDDLSVGANRTLSVRLQSHTELDYVRLQIPLPANVEPVRAQSGYRYIGGLWAYVAQYDDHIELYIERLPMGHRELNMDFHILRPGTYTQPDATLQSEYWPEIVVTASIDN